MYTGVPAFTSWLTNPSTTCPPSKEFADLPSLVQILSICCWIAGVAIDTLTRALGGGRNIEVVFTWHVG